ncbi:Transducin beta-like protein 3 [Nymphon striatum]|nr:Transducin beta-like protein 3 [Nymphon striatum]
MSVLEVDIRYFCVHNIVQSMIFFVLFQHVLFYASSFAIETKYEAFYTGGCIQVSKDGEKLFCRCDGKIEILCVNTGKVEKSIQKDDSDEVTTFVVSNDDLILVAASKNGLLHQWDWVDNKCTRTWKVPLNVEILIDGKTVEQVKPFIYLGQLITEDGRCEKKIRRRIEMAKTTFNKMEKILTSKSINSKLKLRLANCYIWPILTYAFETWTMNLPLKRNINAFEMWVYRRMRKVSWKEKKTNAMVLKQIGVKELNILNTINKRKLGYYGHIRRHDSIQRTILEGKSLHSGPIARLCFDATNTLLATGGTDSSIKIWDVIKQYCTHNLRGGQGVYSVVQFHPDINRLQLFGAVDNVIRAWDLNTSQVVATFENGHFSKVTSLQFTANGNHMFSCGRDSVVIMWDIIDFNAVKTIPVYESVEDIILLPYGRKFPAMNVIEDQNHFITLGSKGCFRIWSASNGKLVYTHGTEISSPLDDSGNELNITQSTFNPQTDMITTITAEHNILMHSLEDLQLKKQFVGHSDEILDIKLIGSEESHILVATNSHYLKLFKRDSFTCDLLKGHTDIVLAIDVFKKDKNIFASSGKDNTVRLWKMDPETFQVTCFGVGSGHTHAIGSLTCSKTSSKFVVSGSQDTTLKLWNVPTPDDTIATITPKITEKAHEKDINSVALSPNDKFMATGSQDKSIKMWNTSDGALIGIMRGHKRGVWCVEFSPIDQVLASSSADGLIKMWAISDFSCVKTFEGHDCSVLKIAFLTRGMQLLSSASDGLLKLWNIRQDECVKTLDGHEGKVWTLAITSDENFLMTGAADSSIILWKVSFTITNISSNWDGLIQVQISFDPSTLVDDVEQQLGNLLHHKKYLKALRIAISLDYPHRALLILKELMIEDDGKLKMKKTLKSLRNDQIDRILTYCVKWNTNSKNCHVAQFVVSVFFQTYKSDELLKFPNAKSHLEGLIPYTERHFQRMKRLDQQVKFLNYMWNSLKLSDNITQLTINGMSDEERNKNEPSTDVNMAEATDSESDSSENEENSNELSNSILEKSIEDNEDINHSNKKTKKRRMSADDKSPNIEVEETLKSQKHKKRTRS